MSMKSSLPILVVVLSLMASSALSMRLMGDDLINPRDPRRHIEQCRQRCKDRSQGFRETRECLERCEKRAAFDDEPSKEVNSYTIDTRSRDPQQEFRQCRHRCQTRQEGGRQQRQCEQRCEKQLERQQGQSYDDEDEESYSPRSSDPQQKFRQCRHRCQTRQEGGRQQRMCEQRCEKQLERQQGRQSYDDEDEEDQSYSPRSRDPHQIFRQCQRRCETQEPGGRQQRMCEQRCEKQLERQQGRQSYDDEDEESYNPYSHDPLQKFRQCQRLCQTREEGGRQERMCEQRCEKQLERQQGRRQSYDDEEFGQGRSNIGAPARSNDYCQHKCGDNKWCLFVCRHP